MDERRALLLSGLAVAFSTLLLAALGRQFAIHLDWMSFRILYVLCGIFLVTAGYCHWRKMDRLVHALATSSLLLLATVPVLISTYIAMGFAYPLADPALIAYDTALGFDWYGFIRFVDQCPLLAKALGYAYQSFSLQLLLLPMFLALSGRIMRSQAMVLAYLIVCLISSAISTIFPALGAFAYVAEQPELANINAHFGYFFLDQFHAIRAEGPFLIEAGKAAGIITFPSVHAAVAVICAWYSWSTGYLRYPILLLNLLMFVSAISHGSHYLVDVLAGGVVAAAAIAIVSRFHRTSFSVCARCLDVQKGVYSRLI